MDNYKNMEKRNIEIKMNNTKNTGKINKLLSLEKLYCNDSSVTMEDIRNLMP